jgi:hypothetical protein
MYSVYRLTNRQTGKSYIGATGLSMARRMGGHRQDAKKGKTSLIAQEIREFGWQSFDVTVIDRFDTRDAMLRAEADAIGQERTLHPHGYNRSEFASSAWKWSDDERSSQSQRCRGRVPWNYGIKTRPMPDAVKEKQRVSHRGQIAWNKGVPSSPETRRLLSSQRMGGGNVRARSIEFDGTQYSSIADAVRATGLTSMQMKYRLAKGKARYTDKG